MTPSSGKRNHQPGRGRVGTINGPLQLVMAQARRVPPLTATKGKEPGFMEHLSQDAKRKLGDRKAAERRQRRRDREAARAASGTGPPRDPSIQPMDGVAERQRQEFRQAFKARNRAEEGRQT